MDKASLTFCAASLLVSLAVAWLAYPLAALPEETVRASQTPQPAEDLGEVDLGGGFGSVPVVELVGYYVENPPAPPAGGEAAAPQIRFGGC